ncbi:hypothetical protein, partial [Salmonella enterica]|uniref:hypothetical protein n=1 Tax=Salmonella enterica TaxID=28901 RepID=UPI0039EABF4E
MHSWLDIGWKSIDSSQRKYRKKIVSNVNDEENFFQSPFLHSRWLENGLSLPGGNFLIVENKFPPRRVVKTEDLLCKSFMSQFFFFDF